MTGSSGAPEIFGDLTVKVVRGINLQVCKGYRRRTAKGVKV